MIAFWLLAAGLIAAAMACLLPPLLRQGRRAAAGRDAVPVAECYRGQLDDIEADLSAGTLAPARGREARDEVARRLLADADLAPAARQVDRPSPLLAAVLLAALPSAAIVLYLQLGNPIALWRADDAAHAHDGNNEPSAAQIEGMVSQLALRLRSDPDDVDGWALLARSYAALERPADAAAAYARAVALAPEEAALRADYADVLASVDGGRLNGAAFEQVQRALALDPDQPKSLALAASAAVERGDAPEAIRHWERLQRLLPPDSQTAARVAANLAQARSSASLEARGDQAAGAASVAGEVSLGGRAGRTPLAGETVFVYARPVDGSRLPLAVLRRRVSDLPFAFVLDDSLAMRPDHRLSGAGQVIVEARISASGNAMPSEGDLVGSTGPVPVGRTDLQLVIEGTIAPAYNAIGPVRQGEPGR